MPARKATVEEVQTALAECTDQLLAKIPVEHVQLSLPLDGRGVRIRASVETDQVAKVPRSIELEVHGTRVRVPIEPAGDYEEMEAR